MLSVNEIPVFSLTQPDHIGSKKKKAKSRCQVLEQESVFSDKDALTSCGTGSVGLILLCDMCNWFGSDETGNLGKVQ